MTSQAFARLLAVLRIQLRMLSLGVIAAVFAAGFSMSGEREIGIPPSIVMACAGLLCGFVSLAFVHHGSELLLTRAVYRREVFFTSALIAVVNAIVIAGALLMFPTWLSSSGPTIILDVKPPLLALANWLLIFVISWSVIVLLQVKMGYHEYLVPTVVVFGITCCTIVGGLVAALNDVGVLDLEASATGSVVIFLILSAIAFRSAKWAFDTYCYTDPGAWTVSGRRATRLPAKRLVRDVQRPKHAAGTRSSTLPAQSRPDKVRYLKPLLWLEFSHWARHPWLWFGTLLCCAIVALFDIQGSILILVCVLYVLQLQVQLAPSPAPFNDPFPGEFDFSIAVPKHVYFRTKAASFILLIALVVVFAALLSRGSHSESTLLLTNRVAEIVGAEPSAEGFDWGDRMVGGFLLIPRSLYGNYTVSSPSITSVVTNGCFAVLHYSFGWLLFAPLAMSMRINPRAAKGTQRGLIRNSIGLGVVIVAFLFFGGPLVAWAFVLAHTHPLYLILSTAAICLLLLRFAERQFVNYEVGD